MATEGKAEHREHELLSRNAQKHALATQSKRAKRTFTREEKIAKALRQLGGSHLGQTIRSTGAAELEAAARIASAPAGSAAAAEPQPRLRKRQRRILKARQQEEGGNE